VNIGTYSYQTCLDYGLTGVMARSAGIKRDLRLSKLETYANYYYLNFRSYLGQHGDSYDRFLIRMNEMSESLNIITQVIHNITKFNKIKIKKNNKNFSSYTTINPHEIIKYVYPKSFNQANYKNNYNSMENLINHFKY
jgi:NADH:ubiquinone oxidoreductase subunit D